MAKLDSTSLRLKKQILERLNAHRPKPLGSRDAFIERLLIEVCEQIEAAEPPGMLPTVQLLREIQHKKPPTDVLQRLEDLEKRLLEMSGKVPTGASVECPPSKAPSPTKLPPREQEYPAGIVRSDRPSGDSRLSLNEGESPNKPIGKKRRALRDMTAREAEQKSSEPPDS